MSKRSRKYFEAFKEFQKLCTEMDIKPPPRQKRKLIPETDEQETNKNDDVEKEETPPSQIKQIPFLCDDYQYSQAPSPPSNLLHHDDDIRMKEKQKSDQIFENDTFFVASIGPKKKRSNRHKTWSDLNDTRVGLFKQSLIPKKGGVVIEAIDDFDATQHSHPLIIIVSAKMNRNEFEQLFDSNADKNEHFVFVTPDFVTSSLKYQKKASFKQFEPRCLTQSQNKNISETKLEKNETSNNQKTKPKVKANGDWLDRNRHKFACQIENDGQRINYNQSITDIFDEMEKIYKCLGDQWREYAYKKANVLIKKHEQRLKNEHDIDQFVKSKKGINKSVRDKCLEIVRTGRLRKLEELRAMPQIRTIELFTKIFGVGHKTAQHWYNMGCRTLDDLQSDQFNIHLRERQKMGLKYFEDFNIKIPRLEIVEIEKFLKKELNSLCPGCTMMICGSYRRGKLKSGDIDVLITHKCKEKCNGLIYKIIDRLHKIGFLVDDLSVPSKKKRDEHDSEMFMGICKLMNDEKYKYYRHIDIKVYKPEHFAFAVLYFTGSDHFNRSMRYFAKKKGWTLSDTHLAPALRQNRTKIHTFTNKAVPCQTEQEIFEALGLKYVEPTKRNTYENFGPSFEATGSDHDKDTNNDQQIPRTP